MACGDGFFDYSFRADQLARLRNRLALSIAIGLIVGVGTRELSCCSSPNALNTQINVCTVDPRPPSSCTKALRETPALSANVAWERFLERRVTLMRCPSITAISSGDCIGMWFICAQLCSLGLFVLVVRRNARIDESSTQCCRRFRSSIVVLHRAQKADF